MYVLLHVSGLLAQPYVKNFFVIHIAVAKVLITGS